MTFSESWLLDHQRKIAGQRLADPPAALKFTLKRPTPLLNVTLRQHWSQRRRVAKAIAAELAPQIPAPPARPMTRAHVRIERRSVRTPDQDGLVASVKPILDALLVRSERHPDGLGICFDDSPAHMTLEVVHVLVAKRIEQGTTIIVTKVGT